MLMLALDSCKIRTLFLVLRFFFCFDSLGSLGLEAAGIYMPSMLICRRMGLVLTLPSSLA